MASNSLIPKTSPKREGKLFTIRFSILISVLKSSQYSLSEPIVAGSFKGFVFLSRFTIVNSSGSIMSCSRLSWRETLCSTI